jgi:hypothetical protein
MSVSPDGKTLDVIEKVSNDIDTYPIHADGTLGAVVINHSVTPGVFAAVFTPTGKLIVSENQPGGTDVSSISSYAINKRQHRGYQSKSAYLRRWQLLERDHAGWQIRVRR